MKILVTGGAGFIGSHLTERLLGGGHHVVVVDNFDPLYPAYQKRQNLAYLKRRPGFRFVKGDVRDRVLMERVFARGKFDCVYHMAGRGGVSQSTQEPYLYLEETLVATMTVLEAAVAHGVPLLVNASSSSVYGNMSGTSSSERSRSDTPRSIYSALKKSSEVLCHAYHVLYGISIVNVRFFSVYGPRGRHDQVVYKFADMIFNSEPIPLLEPESSRDFTYVDDIVDGLVRMLIVRGTSYEIINLGFGRTEKISRVIKLLEKSLRRAAIWGAKIPAPQSDIPASLANTRRAKHLLGWRPSTPLEDGIASFAEWYLAQKRAGPV